MTDTLAAITRSPVTQDATLAVSVTGSWSVFAGKTAHDIDFRTPLASGKGPQTLSLSLHGWACFALRTERNADRPFLFAERHLPMAGGYNFRDIGGFPGADGKRVVWGKLFRTDGLDNLTDADCAYLASIPVRSVVDFRTDEEVGRSPDKKPGSVTNAMHLPIAPGHMSNSATKTLESYENPDDFMLDMYRDLALDESIAGTYRNFFAILQEDANLPLIFHCAAGKDRTGFAAALILHALGVDKRIILAEHEASNKYLGNKYASYIQKYPHLKELFSVKEAFIEEAFGLLESKHGSLTAYLETILDVDIDAMRQRFLL